MAPVRSSHPRIRRHKDGTRIPNPWLGLVIFLSFFALPPGAQAQVRVSAQVDRTQVIAGMPFRYRINLESRDARIDGQPMLANWGGLTLKGQPRTSTQTAMNIFNGIQSIQNTQTFEYILVAPKPGKYMIPAAQITAGGKTYQTEPVGIEAITNQTQHLPVPVAGRIDYIGPNRRSRR